MSWREEKLALGLCGTCGKNKLIPGKKDCSECRERRANKQKERYHAARQLGVEYKTKKRLEFKLSGLCCNCGKVKQSEGTLSCVECIKKHKVYEASIKNEVYGHYGGYKCQCCGETQEKFLTVDHVNNDGAKHRKNCRGSGIYRWIKKHNYPDNFQVLCYNCNCGRARNGGVCPHKR